MAEYNGNLWDRAANAWRRLKDSATLAWTFTTPGEASASIVAGSVGTTQLTDDSVTFAKMQEIATQRVIGRNSSGTGNPEEVTVTQLLDWLANSNRGDIIRRGASAWETLNVGSNGQVLTSDGTDPAWATPTSQVVSTIAAAAISGGATEVDIALGSNDLVEIDLIALEPSDDGVGLEMRFSQDGGSTFLSGASDYAFGFVVAGLAAVDNADSEIRVTGLIGNSTDERATTTIKIFRPSASSFAKTATFSGGGRNATGVHEEAVGWGQLLANANAITHVRFFWSAGTFDAGYYAARAYRFS